MSTPVTLGSTRQFWLAKLTESGGQYAFQEDPAGTTKRAAVYGRTLRLGEPINVGPNSTWHQLTWEGGEGQDIWKDNQMYQWGDSVDPLTYAGKARQWPGLQSWLKDENMPGVRRAIFMQGTRSDISLYQQVCYVAFGDQDPYQPRAAGYGVYQLHPGYTRGDTRAVQGVGLFSDPPRFMVPALDDGGLSNIAFFATSTKLYTFVESSHTFLQDTSAPAATNQSGTNAGTEFMHDTAVNFNGALFYALGNKLYKRVAKPPYGVLGTHTLVHQSRPALWLRGMCIWNNRIYFGVQYPNGKSAVMVTDGATVTKAFDFPQQFQPYKLRAVAGSLYILGQQTSDAHGVYTAGGTPGTVVQQLWRYDGQSLKKLWQQGDIGDGYWHWATDLSDYNGWVMWGRNGTAQPGDGGKACLMFYDPVRDSIVRGPGIVLDAANVGGTTHNYGRGLWINGLGTWHNSPIAFFKDDTDYAHNIKGPGCVVTMRPPGYVFNDLRWHTIDQSGDVNQFKASVNLNGTGAAYGRLITSEYHGEDDIATETKTWLSIRIRCRFSNGSARLRVYVFEPDGSATPDPTSATHHINPTTITWALATSNSIKGNTNLTSTTKWHDVIVPLKESDGTYFQAQKIQVGILFDNTSATYDDTGTAWVDDVAVQYTLAPRTRRQWQVRVPLTDAQLKLDGSANALTTADALGQKLEDLFFAGEPVKFWQPSTSTATPTDGSLGSPNYVEVNITDFQRQQSRMASNETATVGYATMTLVEVVDA